MNSFKPLVRALTAFATLAFLVMIFSLVNQVVNNEVTIAQPRSDRYHTGCVAWVAKVRCEWVTDYFQF